MVAEDSSLKFSVMTFNIENGGTQVDFAKEVEAIKKSGADVVGIQEAWGHTARLAREVGWPYYDQRQHIISRYPLFESPDSKGRYLYVGVRPGKAVAVANMHLPDEPYGPDLIRSGTPAAEVEKVESIVRLPTAIPFVDKLAELAGKGVPVFLTGDFNSPSHLDWTPPTVGVLPIHEVSVVWPSTKYITDKGFVDSYRQLYPDPVKHENFTWPAGRPFVEDTFDGFNPSENDFPDRLDFVFTAGPSKVLSSKVVGEPEYKGSEIHVSPWPSDHRAVVSEFEVVPVDLPKDVKPASDRILDEKAVPEVAVAKAELQAGEPLVVTWNNAPGNRFDYIRITPVGSKRLAWGEAIRLYTRGEHEGTVTYDDSTVKGNWLDWYKSDDGHWPLKPGEYDIKLMLDDGFTELAATKVRIR